MIRSLSRHGSRASQAVPLARLLALGTALFVSASCSFGAQATSPTVEPLTSTATAAPSTATPTSTPLPPTPTFTPEPPSPTPTPFPLPPPVAPIAGRPAWSPALLMSALRHGDTTRPVVYLTFDDGYGFPEEVLAILEQRRARATACLAGAFMEKRRSFVQRWVAAGLSLCNHSYTHAHLTRPPAARPPAAPGADPVFEAVRSEISESQALLAQIAPGAASAPFFRPPYGEQNDAVRAGAASLGYRTILWSNDARDWRPNLNATSVRDYVVDNARNGDVIILHFERRSTVDALPFIIDGLRARGFEILGLESLPSDR